jgi:hypothetical protein
MSGGNYPPWNGHPLDIPNTPGPLSGDPRYPGRGYLPRPGEDRPALSAWGRLSRGGALGKKANLAYRASDVSTQNAVVPILNVEGDDADAQQVVITLGQPLVVAQPFSQALATSSPQNITGEQDNLQMQSRTSFPGTPGVPVVWPPISAVIEWGIGGASNTAVVDFVDGANVTVLASFVRVKAAIESLADTGVTGTSAIYTLYAQVGPGFSRCHAQRTIFVGSVASLAESGLHAVPKFAKSAYLIGCDPTAGSAVAVTVATLRFWQSPDGAAGGRNVGNFFFTGNVYIPAPVPNAAMYASVVSGMAASTRFLVVYELVI